MEVQSALIGAGLAGAAALAWYLYLRQARHLEPEEALQQAIKFGAELWLNGEFKAAAALARRGAPKEALIEAASVLRGEILGRSSIPGVQQSTAKPHPELATVDLEDLARGLHHEISTRELRVNMAQKLQAENP